MITRYDILNHAFYYRGCLEGSALHGKLIDCYNQINPLPRGYHVKYTDPWCAAYVSAIMKMAGLSNFPSECGVYEMKKKFEMAGESYEFQPKIARDVYPADLIFFKHSHVGIITGITNTIVWTIEGNANDSVMTRHYSKNDPSILGYGIIDLPIDSVVTDVISGKYGNGVDRRNRLRKDGYNYEEVQKDVNIRLRGWD